MESETSKKSEFGNKFFNFKKSLKDIPLKFKPMFL